ncbi:MAG: hypothetical protein ACR2LC_03195 [Pyrinomonadaceae bacterium]
MPLSSTDAAKLESLQSLLAGGQRIRLAELVKIEWPPPDGTAWYAFTQIDKMFGFTGIQSFADVRARILANNGSPFLDLTRTAAISDDTIDLAFSDIDGEISRLCFEYGAGVRVRVYAYYPDVDLLLESFVGLLRAPKEADGRTIKVGVTSGWRSAKLLLPNRPPAPGCPFIFGGLLSSQYEIDEHNGCPYNVHVGGSIGVPGLTDCTRDSVATCFAHLGTTRYFPGFKTVIDTVVIGQTKGPNLQAQTRGNDASLTDPIRMIYGERFVKGLRLLAYAAEPDTKHPDKGFVKAQFEIAEGPLQSLTAFKIKDVLVGFEHLNLRFGELGQAPTAFSPNINPYSGTAVGFGRIMGDYRNITAGDLTASVRVQGLRDIRVYSNAATFARSYSTNRAWCLADMLTRKRCAYGEDYERQDIESLLDTAAWCNESVLFRDRNGNDFSGTRSTFNAELNARTTQTQIDDACAAGRIGLAYRNGLRLFVALRKETIDDSIPVFIGYGENANICANDQGKALVSWSYTGDDELVNQYTITFDDSGSGGQSIPLVFGDQRQQLAAGKVSGDTTLRVINKDAPAFGITNMHEAARFGNMALALGLLDKGGIENNLEVKLTTWFSQALRVVQYKLVQVLLRGTISGTQTDNYLLDQFGFQYFRVMDIKRKGNLQVELTCRAYPVTYMNALESAPAPIPPQFVDPNPGGGRGDVPCPVAFRSFHVLSDRIEMELEHCL